MQRFVSGFGDLWAGFGLVLRVPSLSKWAIWPIILNALLFAAMAALVFLFVDDFLRHFWTPRSFGGTFLFWLSVVALWAIGLIVAVLLVLVLSSVIAAPFYTKLSEAALRHLGREVPPTGSLFHIAAITIWQECVKLAFFIGIQAVLIAFHFIPVAGTILSVLVTCLLLAFEFLDYALEPLGFSVSGRWKFVLAHKPESLGFGAAAFVVTFVPGLNLLTAPAAVAGGAKMVVRLQEAQQGADVR
jgi:CysZ protein